MRLAKIPAAAVVITTVALAACGSEAEDAARPDTTTTEATTTTADTTTTVIADPTTTVAPITTEPPDCQALEDQWWDADAGSNAEEEAAAALVVADCDFQPPEYDSDLQDLDGVISIETAGDVALAGGMPLNEFCSAVDSVGYDLALAAWESGFAGAAEEFGFSDKEVFDEVMSRC